MAGAIIVVLACTWSDTSTFVEYNSDNQQILHCLHTQHSCTHYPCILSQTTTCTSAHLSIMHGYTPIMHLYPMCRTQLQSFVVCATTGVLCGAAASGNFEWTPENVAKSLLCMVMSGPLLTGYTQTINDYYDKEIDAINEPDRPIPSGMCRYANRHCSQYASLMIRDTHIYIHGCFAVSMQACPVQACCTALSSLGAATHMDGVVNSACQLHGVTSYVVTQHTYSELNELQPSTGLLAAICICNVMQLSFRSHLTFFSQLTHLVVITLKPCTKCPSFVHLPSAICERL